MSEAVVTTNETELPAAGNEAPASLNFRLVSPSGTWVQFTMRSSKMSAVYKNFLDFEKILIGAGWGQPPSKETIKATTEEAHMCPVHHAPMKQFQRKDGTGSFWSHSTDDTRYPVTAGGKRYCHGEEPKGE